MYTEVFMYYQLIYKSFTVIFQFEFSWTKVLSIVCEIQTGLIFDNTRFYKVKSYISVYF